MCLFDGLSRYVLVCYVYYVKFFYLMYVYMLHWL